MRQTLRTNNKALARALEKARSDVNDLQNENIQLQRDKQILQDRLCILERIAGATNEKIDQEVQVRIKVSLLIYILPTLFLSFELEFSRNNITALLFLK